jgi:hypothetical protein
MMKGKNWDLQGGRAWNLYKTQWTQKLKRNMRKNMKIPRKKENPKQPIIIPRIISLPAWFEPQSTKRNGSCDEEQCM